MSCGDKIRVLYSFPHKLGAGRICWTAWQQVIGLDSAGVHVTAFVGCAAKKPPPSVRMVTTMALGRFRIPYRILGTKNASVLHDFITSLWLRINKKNIDIVHAWPLGAIHTIRAARELGIPVLIERPNCHTAFAYEVVETECRKLDVFLPKGYEHKFDAKLLDHETREYATTNFLLCPSDFVKKTFLDRGLNDAKLLRHQYGYDESLIGAGEQNAIQGKGLTMLYAGLGTPRKGLHYALKAWLASEASRTGRFLICGEILDVYREKLAGMLAHPSVAVLGHRTDLSDLMKQADLFVLSSIEEGSALVTYEARAAGCVLLVSDATGAVCNHMENGLIHSTSNVVQLTSHMDLLHGDRQLLGALRNESLRGVQALSWRAAGARLAEVYEEAIALYHLDYQTERRQSCAEL